MTAGSAETLDAPRSPSSREGQAPACPSFFNVGGLIDGRYAIVRPIGRGGMGRVVEVERISDQARLALKYCDGSALGRKRLVREARILGGLEHPHLLPVVDANLDHDPPYFVMPLAAGTLESELHERGARRPGPSPPSARSVRGHGPARGRDRPSRPQTGQHPEDGRSPLPRGRPGDGQARAP